MPNKTEVSLDDMIAKNRKQKASELATAMLGRKRHETKSGVNGTGNGVIKQQRPQAQRAFSSGSGIGNIAARTTGKPASIQGKWTHDLHHKNNPQASRVSKLPTTISPSIARNLQNNRLFAALHGDQVNVQQPNNTTGNAPKNVRRHSSGPTMTGGGTNNNGGVKNTLKKKNSAGRLGGGGPGLSIRGAAGPAVVQAANFAPGTTAEDIKHAMQPLGKILSCMILTSQPTVICEVVFETKSAAENCVAQYNEQVADGRVLNVFVKPGPPVGRIPGVNAPPERRSQERESSHSYRYEDSMDLDEQRAEADRRRREMNISYQDGRYGVRAPSLYSDALIQRGRGFTK